MLYGILIVEKRDNMRIVLAAGGTGGHVFPAISLGEYIRDEMNGEILFIGVNGKMEAQEVPKHNIPFMGVEARGFVGSITNRMKCLQQVEVNIRLIKKKLKEFKPDIVMGFGGYVSVPVLIAAKQLNIPIMIHEQNSVAGLANKMLGKISDGNIICFKHAESFFPKSKVRFLGSPRASSLAKRKKDDSILKELNIQTKLPLGLIVMGSLGSESVNAHMVGILKHFSEYPLMELIYVTGKNHYEEMKKECGELNSYIHIVPFIDQERILPHLDFMVCRAGATTIAELCAIGVPSIIIPSPYVAHNHQVLNASELARNDACIMIEEKDLTRDEMIGKMLALSSDNKLKKKLHDNALLFGKINACEEIYEYIEEIIKNKNG